MNQETIYSNFYSFIEKQLELIAEHYEKSAPTVNQWADNLYRHFSNITMEDVNMIQHLTQPEFLQPNYAANSVYHLLVRQGKNTDGQAGF